jgi:outer membrane biogenesis lipoprotein LolB
MPMFIRTVTLALALALLAGCTASTTLSAAHCKDR